MMKKTTQTFLLVLSTLLLFVSITVSAQAQGTEPQVASGTGVSVETQATLGLVTINNGCSGTMLNQFWVLTARHCVTDGNKIANDLQSPNRVQITAAWAAKTATASRIYDFKINSDAGSARDRDIVLVYLGSDNFGQTASQKIFAVYRDGKLSGRLKDTDTVTQYGIGYSTFAKDLMTPSSGLGIFRSAVFNPSEISATHYRLNMNVRNQSGHGGDSGGPSMVTVNGQPSGIAGVQSTCNAAGYIPGAPAKDWLWATGINFCTYVSTEPFLNEISKVIQEAPSIPPYIAGGYLKSLPFEPFGYAYLGWDAGPGHSNAQVWMTIDKGPDIPAFSIDYAAQHPIWKQPKISGVGMKLQKAHLYRFLLKDGGITLAIVDFYVY